VRSARDRRHARHGNLGCEPPRERLHVVDVRLAPEDERRCVHLAPARSDVRHEHVLLELVPVGRLHFERAPLHLGHSRPHHGIDVLRGAPRAVHPLAQIVLGRCLQVATRDSFVLRGAISPHVLGPVHPRQSRIHEHQLRNEVGTANGHLERHAAAKRCSDQAGARRAEPIEQLDDVLRIGDAQTIERRAPEPGEVAAKQAVVARERRPLRLPHPAVGDSRVQEDDRGAVALRLMREVHG
jgi:hypothetical protein